MENFLATVRETVNPATQPVGVNLIRDSALIAGLKIKVRGKRAWPSASKSPIAGIDPVHLDRRDDRALCAGSGQHGTISPLRVLDGTVNTGVYQETREAAAAMQKLMPRVEPESSAS